MPTPGESQSTQQWRHRASEHQLALKGMATKDDREHQVHILHLSPSNYTSSPIQTGGGTGGGAVKRITEHIQAVGEPRMKRLIVPSSVSGIHQPVKPGKFLIHSNLKLVTSRRDTTETTASHARALMSSVVKTATGTTTAIPSGIPILTGIPIITAVTSTDTRDDRRPANIVVKSLPRGVHALQLRNTDATYLIPVTCPVTLVPRTTAPSSVQVAALTRPKPDPALQEQLLEFDKVCKEVKERSAPVRNHKRSGSVSKATTASIGTTIDAGQNSRTDEEHKHAKIYAILAEYHKKLANSPDLNNKPAPRRRSAPPQGTTVVATKRKKVTAAAAAAVAKVATPKEPQTTAATPSTSAVVNYVSIVRPLRIALGSSQRLVALSGAALPTTSATLAPSQTHQCPARPKVLVLEKPSGQYVIKSVAVNQNGTGGAPKVIQNEQKDTFRQDIVADCEDLGVDIPNASDLFPEADYLLEECLAPTDFGAEEVIEAPPADTVIRTLTHDRQHMTQQ